MFGQAGRCATQTALDILYYLPYWKGKGKLTLRLLQGASPHAAKMPFGSLIWIGADAERQTLLPYWIGQYEAHVLRSFRRQLRTLKEGTSIVDVGANLGFYTVTGAGYLRLRGTGKIFAFEPNPEAFAELARNVALNGFTNVEISPDAVASKPGATHFFPNPAGITLGSLKPAVNSPGVSVAQTTLDALREQSGEIGLIKIDVEGAELLVLEGARRVMERDRPGVIFEQFDDAYHRFGYSMQEVYRYFHSLEYTLYWIREKAGGRIARIEMGDTSFERSEHYRNILALPKEHK